MSFAFDFSGSEEELFFIPLGGSGEFGGNFNLYGHGGQYLAVDMGMGFGDDSTPGVDILVPDPAFLEDRRDQVVGLVLTHAHEDHIGAVAWLWPRLGCPIYGTAFTLAMLKPKLREAGLLGRVDLREVRRGGRVRIGAFDVSFIPVTHSIPEASLLAIRTSVGLVVHTGDWKLDPEPVIGPLTDEEAIRALGEEGVLAVVGDSTGALSPGHSGSEGALRRSLEELFGRWPESRIAVACFASNVARVESITQAAAAHDRHVALVGRSLLRMDEAARACGYFRNLPPFVEDGEVGYLPRDKCLLVVTGSQAEPRSALSRIAEDTHPEVSLEPGDVVIFSARAIPGNELEINRLQNQLTRRGIEVVTDRDAFVHVSGHPARDELARLYQMLRPRILVPVHGELHHLSEHARLAASCQIAETVVPENGFAIRLAPGPAEVVAEVPSGRLGIDGNRLVALDGPVLRSRQRLVETGAVMVTVVLDRAGSLRGDPALTTLGLIDETAEPEILFSAADAVREAFAGGSGRARQDDDAARQLVRSAVRRQFNAAIGKKPLVEVHVIRV